MMLLMVVVRRRGHAAAATRRTAPVAAVRMVVVMTGRGQFVEVQGSGEEATFSPDQLTSLVALAQRGLREVTALQTAFLAKRLL